MLNTDDTLLLIVDIQEKLVSMLESDAISEKAAKLLNAAKVLNLPVVITEQYPRGLGNTLASLKQAAPSETVYFEKISFSAMREEGFNDLLAEFKRENILICGIETHICVYQTTADLLDEGYEVEVISDITASRREVEHKTGLEKMKWMGASITSFETVIFELMKSSKHPGFKEIQALIK